MKKVIFLPLAEQEMNEAAIFYETHSRGQGQAFLSAIKSGKRLFFPLHK